MYLRTVKAQGHEYLRLVESFRRDGKTKQRIITNLGRKELLAPHLDDLVRLLQGEDGWVRTSEITPTATARWGPVLVAQKLWEELGLDDLLDSYERGKGGTMAPLADRAFVLVANRLSCPGSEHALAGWLETHYVCDRRGRRWMPEWEERGRVQVNLTWLQRWYRTLDELVAHKEQIEQALYFKLRDLFSLEVELVFYDLTSSYFEGDGPEALARFGYSRDGKPRNRQLLVGMVMVNGWPIAHHVFPGGLRDFETVPGVVKDLEKRFGLKRVVFVGDRGMVTSDNVTLLRQGGHGYLVGLQRRRREKIYQFMQKATGPWLECPSPAGGAKTYVQEVAGDETGVRVLVVHSEERLAYEQKMRQEAMEKTRQKLARLARRVAKGRLKAPEKIGAAAARILSRHHGHRYFDWEIKDGKFHYFEAPQLVREKAYEGKYLIQTEEPGLTPLEAVAVYKELTEVESAFRCLKDVIELRPIYHRDEERVQGHIFVAALAFLLKRMLEKKLQALGVNLTGEAALKGLHTVDVVGIELGSKQKVGITGGNKRAREVLKALGIVPTPPPQAT